MASKSTKQKRKRKSSLTTQALRAKQFVDKMEKNGWSRADLARQLGVSRAWVTMVLKSTN